MGRRRARYQDPVTDPHGLDSPVGRVFAHDGHVLLLGVDHFLDMGRTLTNVLGNAIAASVVAKTEDSLGETQPEGELAKA